MKAVFKVGDSVSMRIDDFYWYTVKSVNGTLVQVNFGSGNTYAGQYSQKSLKKIRNPNRN